MAESSRMRTMDRSYEDIEMKGASASETGVKNDMDSSSDIQEIMENGDQDKRDMLRLGKQQELKRAWGFWSALGFVGKSNIHSLGGKIIGTHSGDVGSSLSQSFARQEPLI
jgi:hypothetical protein